MTMAALIVAGGRGIRAGSDSVPKQYRHLAGKSVLRRTLETFLAHPAIDRVLVVIGAEDAPLYSVAAPQHDHLLSPAIGGDTRQESVRRGLAALTPLNPRRVLVHDGVRPFLSPSLIDRVTHALEGSDAVVPLLPVSSTLKSISPDGKVGATVPREGLYAAETPQGFDFAAIRAAHERAAAARLPFTDDAGVAEWAGLTVSVVPGEAGNVKLTTAGDLAAAERRLAGEAALHLADIRVGTGYDVHAFGSGTSVTLGGVAIPHEQGLAGHSDADVALHALTDAILGALAEGDIGQHFPPSDGRWRGAPSETFLAFAVERVRARGGRIAHVDLAIIAEAPKIAPHREAMRARIGAVCGIPVDRVAVKATTNEGLGFVGRREGIAAIATATLRLPAGENA
jgi:2-C-methyl-D-erythritol 4-phosphate cytidylyltransferase / 2-C-methyl-D-erythritol 2,4-cyclodiphosphate synthase